MAVPVRHQYEQGLPDGGWHISCGGTEASDEFDFDLFASGEYARILAKEWEQ